MGSEIDFFGFKFVAEGRRASTVSEMLEVFDFLKPKPSPKPLIRIGENQDGAYLVPDDLGEIAACFSPGVDNFKYFEDYLVQHYGIDCHMCDYSSDIAEFATPLIAGKQTFLKKWLDNQPGADNISLDDWVREKAPDGDLILQIDVEGAEYRNLLSVSDEVLSRFRIIVIEVHSLHLMDSADILQTALLPFFRRLDSLFSVAHAHANNCCGAVRIPGTDIHIPRVLELTYIRRDRFGGQLYPCLIPHPLDVKNVPKYSNLYLGEEWLDGARPVESRLKILEDRLDDQSQGTQAQPGGESAAHQALMMRSRRTLADKAKSLVETGPDTTGRIEVAQGRTYALSSAYDGVESGIVQPSGDFFFHTNVGPNQFIQIDLDAQRDVQEITLSNRLDSCFDRARNLFVIISDTPDYADGDTFSVPFSDEFLQGKEQDCAFWIPPSRGRFVTIVSSVETALHFSDIKIYAAN